MSSQSDRYLLVGLGNPGRNYEYTRHNIGFRCVKFFAEREGAQFKPALSEMKGTIAHLQYKDKEMVLLLPMTYMNQSGLSVKMSMDYFKVFLDHLLIISDDIDLPFGKLRLRAKGGAGGHNGLKSVEAHLGSELYSRLKVGVGDRLGGELADYVLDNFSVEEEKKIPEILKQVCEAVGIWVESGIEPAMRKVNKNGENGE